MPPASRMADQLPELRRGLWIQAARRLVEEQEVRVAGQGTGQRETLLLAARQLDDPAPALRFELHHLEEFVHRVAAVIEGAKQQQRLLYRQFVGELRFLQLDAETLT